MHTPKNKYTSFTLLSGELIRRGYTAKEIYISNKFVEFTAPNGYKWLTRRALLSYPFMSLAAMRISTNKQLAYEFAQFHGVSTPQSLLLPDEAAQTEEFLKQFAPVVVKPLDSLGGHGMRLGISDFEELKDAVSEARKRSDKVLVQQQFMGDELRFTLIKGEVASVILRQTPRVVGDGVSSIAELIAQENEMRKNLGFEIVPYPQLDGSLIAEHFLHDSRVPAKDEVVEFSKSTLVGGGGQMHDITDKVHASYVDLARRLGSALNPDFITVDMLVTDYTKPQTDENYVFLEFSTAPSLRLYYDVRSGTDRDIVSQLADMIDERSRQV